MSAPPSCPHCGRELWERRKLITTYDDGKIVESFECSGCGCPIEDLNQRPAS